MLGWGWTTFLVVVAAMAFLAGLAEPSRDITPAERRRLAGRARVAGAEPEPTSPTSLRGGGTSPIGRNAAPSRRTRTGLIPGGRPSLTRRNRHVTRIIQNRRVGLRIRGLPAYRRS